MSLRTTLSGLWQTRRLLRTLERVAMAQEEQVVYLKRLADHVAPQITIPTPEDLKIHTGLTFSRDEEMAKVLAYCERVFADTGHEPTEDEVAAYLDEAERAH